MSTPLTDSSSPNAVDDHGDDLTSPDVPEQAAALMPARPPLGVGLSPVVAQVIALLLVGLAVLAVQDALARTNVVRSGSWLRSVVAAPNGMTAADWMVVPFAALIVLGLIILPIAFRRRPRKTVSLAAQTGVYLRSKDLASITKSRLEGTEGVVDVDVSASRKRIKVVATSLSPAERNDTVVAAMTERMAPVLGAIERAPRLSVHIRNEKFS